MESFNKYLKQFPNYRSQSYEMSLPLLLSKFLEAGDYLLPQGKICQHIYFIESGLIRLYYLNNGKEVTHCFCRENTITTSYRSLVTRSESDIAIQAIEKTKLIVFPYHGLQSLYERDPFWQQVGRLVVENELLSTECHSRFIKEHSAIERYKKILHSDADLLQRVPLNYLASYLQVAPETLSRIRKKISTNLT